MSGDALSVTGLSAGYGARTIVRDFDAGVLKPGETVALIGPNGAGKSTLLRAIAGLVPARGSVRLGARELVGLPLAERAKLVAYLPQSLPQGVSLTVLDTVVAAMHAAPGARGLLRGRSAADCGIAVLEQLDADDLALRMTHELSGGQSQLVGLAQALVREPKVLLLDEPTSALDLRFQVMVLDRVRALTAQRGLISVLVLHDLQAAARVADRVIVMHQGRAVANGPPEIAITTEVLAEVYRVRARVGREAGHALHVIVDDII